MRGGVCYQKESGRKNMRKIGNTLQNTLYIIKLADEEKIFRPIRF